MANRRVVYVRDHSIPERIRVIAAEAALSRPADVTTSSMAVPTHNTSALTDSSIALVRAIRFRPPPAIIDIEVLVLVGPLSGRVRSIDPPARPATAQTVRLSLAL